MLDLVTALHKGLQEKEKQRHEWDKTAIHVTDLSITLGGDDGGCAHSLWKRVRNYPRAPETLGQMLMFDNAHSLHERAAELMDLGLPKDWEIVEIEKSVAHKLPKGMKGRLDVKLRNKESGVTLIVDIKTVRGNAFKFLDKPKPAHVLQVQTYIWAENADGGLIVYLDREGQNAVLQFSVPRADDRVLDAMARTVRLISAETPPPIMEPKVTYKTYKTVDALLVVKSPWQCLEASTPVLTKDGYKAISDVVVGDYVVTRNGYRRVVKTGARSLGERKVFAVKPYYGLPVFATQDHPFLVGRYPNLSYKVDDRQFEWVKPDSICASEGKPTAKLYLGWRTEEIPVDISDSELRLLGLWMAEGHFHHKRPRGGYYKTGFTLSAAESELADLIISDARNVLGEVSISNKVVLHPQGSESRQVIIYSQKAYEFISKFVVGTKAKNKHFIDNVLKWPVDRQRVLLQAMQLGDGCLTRDTNTGTLRQVYSTASKALVLQVFEMYQRAGYFPSINVSKQSVNSFGSGGLAYNVGYRKTDHPVGRLISNAIMEVPIQYVEQVDWDNSQLFYDLEIEDDHEFVTIGGIVHNCDWCPLRGISCAGALGEHARRLDVEFRVNAAGELRVVKVEKKDEQPMSEEDVKKGVAELEAVARLYLERQQTETNTPEVAS